MLCTDKKVVYVHEPFNIGHSEERYNLPLRHWFTHLPDLENSADFHEEYEKVLALKAYPRYPPSFARHFALRCQLQDRWRAFSERRGANTALVKDPLALLSAPELAARYDMQVLCMIRQPLAFCSSIKKWNWDFPFEHFLQQPELMKEHFSEQRSTIEQYTAEKHELVDQAILLWNLLHGVIKRYQEQHPDWVFLRHEDAVQDPLPVFEKVCAQLDLKFSEKRKEEIKKSVSANEGETSDPSYKQREQNDVLNTWKERLSEAEVEKITRETQSLADHFYPA